MDPQGFGPSIGAQSQERWYPARRSAQRLTALSDTAHHALFLGSRRPEPSGARHVARPHRCMDRGRATDESLRPGSGSRALTARVSRSNATSRETTILCSWTRVAPTVCVDLLGLYRSPCQVSYRPPQSTSRVFQVSSLGQPRPATPTTRFPLLRSCLRPWLWWWVGRRQEKNGGFGCLAWWLSRVGWRPSTFAPHRATMPWDGGTMIRCQVARRVITDTGRTRLVCA